MEVGEFGVARVCFQHYKKEKFKMCPKRKVPKGLL